MQPHAAERRHLERQIAQARPIFLVLALGDLQTLRSHGLPAEIIRLEGDPASALRELHNRIEGML